MSRSTGRSSSRATEWSQWEWNETYGFWESWRINSRGVTEWKRDPPASSAPADPLIPRNQEGLYALMPSPYPNNQVSDQPPATPFLNPGEPTSFEPSYTSSSESTADHTGDHYVTSTSYVTTAGTSAPTYFLQRNDDLYSAEPSAASSGTPYSNSGYGSSPNATGILTYTAVPSTPVRYDNFNNSQSTSNHVADFDTLTQRVGRMSVGSTINEDEECGSQAAGPYVPTRYIQSERHRSKAEKLDPRYKVVSDKDSRWFWKFGRVFMMLWTEPAGYKVGGGTKGNSHISGTWLNEKAYSEIRRFVVVRDNHGSCQCLAVHTYNKWATLKPNLPEPNSHAVIYTSRDPPKPFSLPDKDGNPIYEQLTKDPIKVNSELRGEDGKLMPESRINYSKIYCVEKDVRVLNIGLVDKNSLIALELDCPLKPQRKRSPSRKRTSGKEKEPNYRY